MEAAADSSSLQFARPRSRVIRDGFTVGGTIVAILASALLSLLTPWVMHPALDAAQSAAWLATEPATAHAISDRTIDELLFGPGTFSISGVDGGAFYDPAEIAHLRDARTLLWSLFAAGMLSMLAISVALVRSDAPASIVRAIGMGGVVTALGVVVIGAVGLVAFEPLFELFHKVFFPGGNWAFDPRTEQLVQLYPYAFWQLISAALGIVAAAIGVIVWLVARLVVGPAAAGAAR